MIEISIDYQGQLRCSATHGPSGDSLATDAKADAEDIASGTEEIRDTE